MLNNIILYTLTSLIWGSTWYAIQFQVEDASPMWSIVYRFTIATFILFIFCIVTKKNLKFSFKNHIAMAIQGLLLFCLNYIFFYISSDYLISGTVAVLSANIQFINILNSRLIFKVPIKLSVIISAVMGLMGLTLVFISQISKIYPNHAINHTQQIIGLIFCLIGTLFASWGNMASAYNQKQQLPIIQSNAYGMFYGSLFTLILAIIFHQKPSISWTLPYIGTLFYLAIFGSVIAFGSYLKLLGQIGPGRAAYIFVITPLIALLISTFFEHFEWHLITIVGIILIVLGNILALYKPEINIINKSAERKDNINAELKYD